MKSNETDIEEIRKTARILAADGASVSNLGARLAAVIYQLNPVLDEIG